MQALVEVILPVFLVLGFGYLAVWTGLFDQAGVDGLMRFATTFAIPLLLFRAISQLDLQQQFDIRLLASFYPGAAAGFAAGMFGARYLFGRPWEDSVAIGFGGLFSNAVLLGLPIVDRAFGPEALRYGYAIVSIHAPFCYGLGVTVMEIVRNRGGRPVTIARRVLSAMFRNALVIGIALGFAVNLSGLHPPEIVLDAVDLVVRAALPAALFGLGGILVRYRPEGDLRIAAYLCAVSLVLHPAIAYGLGLLFDLSADALRAAVATAAMAPGVNAYIFASIYGRGKRVAATTLLMATGLSIPTVWIWLAILP